MNRFVHRFTVVCVLAGALMVASPGLLTRPASATDDPGAAVRGAVGAFGKAFRAADVDALRGMLTENYMHVNGGSGNVLNREQWLSWLASRRAELDDGVLNIRTYEVAGLDVRMHGDMAIVTGTVHASGRRKGEAFSTALRFTNVWVLEEGTWKRAAFHDSVLPSP